MRKSLDLELDMIVSTLIKKGLESGSFIGTHVTEVLETICECCSENRVATALLGVLGATKSTAAIANPAPAIKLRAVNCFDKLIQRLGARFLSFKDGDKVVAVLAAFLSEGSLEVRTAAKKALMSAAIGKAVSPIDFDRLLQRALNEATYAKVKTMLAKEASESPFGQSKGWLCLP